MSRGPTGTDPDAVALAGVRIDQHDPLVEFLIDEIDIDVQYGNAVVNFPALAAALRKDYLARAWDEGYVAGSRGAMVSQQVPNPYRQEQK